MLWLLVVMMVRSPYGTFIIRIQFVNLLRMHPARILFSFTAILFSYNYSNIKPPISAMGLSPQENLLAYSVGYNWSKVCWCFFVWGWLRAIPTSSRDLIERNILELQIKSIFNILQMKWLLLIDHNCFLLCLLFSLWLMNWSTLCFVLLLMKESIKKGKWNWSVFIGWTNLCALDCQWYCRYDIIHYYFLFLMTCYIKYLSDTHIQFICILRIDLYQ